MVINVSEALDSDTAQVRTVERKAPGAYVGGIYQKGATTTFKALMSVQQPTPKQLETLPEGERSRDVKLFISNKPLRTTEDKDETIADVVIDKGKRYKIISSGDWSDYGHTTAMGVREE